MIQRIDNAHAKGAVQRLASYADELRCNLADITSAVQRLVSNTEHLN
jgi:hypothetical protein